MASIFTYDPDPPRVASPWLHGAEPEAEATASQIQAIDQLQVPGAPISTPVRKDTGEVTRLQAEPQEGPVEYKLHLLLRPRRIFQSTSTGGHVSGSRHSKFTGPPSRGVSESAASNAPSPPAASTHQTRQHRLEQLTTQLLWRLQQSSPHHASSSTNIILPSLPEALPELQPPQQPAKLLHGLEESQGALYEIGVSDDGAFAGLAEDELNESLNNLRAMAASLGCVVEVLRKVPIGECEWLEDMVVGGKNRKVRRSGKLLVVEAFVKPNLQMNTPSTQGPLSDAPADEAARGRDTKELPPTEQLRVTLTGPTMSGKSSLLGTLSTSVLDNGRGKSRLSMLKHRHEITSGLTSSVTQELIGYQDKPDGDAEVINYATNAVVSWIDIHVAAAGSRLVFISDSAGHPRYRRTIVRGLVGWAPHWTVLCIPADDTEDTSGRQGSTAASQEVLGAAASDIDLSGAQLDLCLRLSLPFIVVITKLDLASRQGLRSTLAKLLSSLKAAGRKPVLMPNVPGLIDEEPLQNVTDSALGEACKTVVPLIEKPLESVPIVLTSAVQGSGIDTLHALLHELPIPTSAAVISNASETVFYIEDIYNKPADGQAIIVSGRSRCGQIAVRDELWLGPFTSHDSLDDSEDFDERPVKAQTAPLPTSAFFPGDLTKSHLLLPRLQYPKQEWRSVNVSSIRNLRLPVHELHQDQVGTVGIVPTDPDRDRNGHSLTRIRKGMVLANTQPQAIHTFIADFKREDLGNLAVGSHVVVYIASVRASAKVLSARTPDAAELRHPAAPARETLIISEDHLSEDQLVIGLENHHGHLNGQTRTTRVAGAVTHRYLLVTFHFEASKEFVMVRDQVLVMPGGGPGLYGGTERGEKGVAGLEGFVGVVMETFG